MARFFIATLNYAPEPTGFAPRATLLAEHLARQGHDVSVFTGFPFAPHWRRRIEDRGRLYRQERNGQLTIHRLTHFIPRRPSSAVQRIAMEGSFSAAGFLAMIRAVAAGGRPDVILYIGAQPAIAVLARVVAGLTRRPYFVNITDLAAQLALDVGIVGPRLYRTLDAMEFVAYRKAAGASVLCQSFEEALVQHGYPPARIRLSRDPIDVDHVRPVPRDGTFRTQYGIAADAFVVLHAGSMGLKQGLMNVVAAAELTRNERICWVLVGDGEARGELVEAVRRRGLEHSIRFVPFQDDAAVPRMFADADALLLNQLKAVKDTVIPSKLLTYMAAGRPVLAAVNATSQAAAILIEAEGGRLVTPEDPGALAAGARWLVQQPARVLDEFGARNRAYAVEHFDQRRILAAHEQFMLSAIGPVLKPAS